MNLFNLFATITLDDNDYKNKLSQGEKTASSFSSKVSSSLRNGENAVKDFSDVVGDMSDDYKKNFEKNENATNSFSNEVDNSFDKSEEAVEDFSDTVDDMADDYKKNLQNSEKNSSSFASNLGKAFKTAASAIAGVVAGIAGAATAMGALAVQAIDYAGDLDDNATRVGMSTEAYQEWAFAMQLAGADATVLQTAVRNLTTFTGNLSAGNEDAIASLEALGVSYEEFMELPVEEQLNAVVNGLQGLKDQTEMTQIAQEVFGSRVYQQLMPLLTQEKGYVDELGQSMSEMGMIMSDDAVKAGAALGDQLDILKQRITIVGQTMVSDLFPEIEMLLEGLNGLASGSDDAMNQMTEGLIGLIDKVAEALPTIMSTATDLLLNVLVGLIQAISSPEVIANIVGVIETLLFTTVQLLPTLVGALMDVAVALFDALLSLDWGNLIIELLNALIQIVFTELPQMVADLLISILDTIFNLFFTEGGRDALVEFGKSLAESIINGLISMAESGVNLLIDLVNGMLDGLSSAWTWLGIPAIPHIPSVSFGRVDFAEGGMFPESKGTLYALAGEEGAEIVARGSRGTGVANVEQIAQAQYEAMQDYDLRGTIQQAASAIVNGIVGGLSATDDTAPRIVVQIGEREFKTYIMTVINDTLKSQGRKTINAITSY